MSDIERGDNTGISSSKLERFVQRIERAEEEKAVITDAIKDIYTEAKEDGFDTAVMRIIIRLRKIDPQKRRETEELVELYKSALGMD